MILGPIILVVFLVGAGITYAITRDGLKSLGIGGAIAAVPIGAYFGGFFGALIAAVLGAGFGVALPIYAVAAAYLGFLYAIIMPMARFQDAIGVPPFLVIPELLLVWFGSLWLFMWLINLRAAQSDNDAPKSADKPEGGGSGAADAPSNSDQPLPTKMDRSAWSVLAVLLVVVAGLVVLVLVASSNKESRRTEMRAEASRATAERAEPAEASATAEPVAPTALPHFSSLLGKRAATAEAWCAAKRGTWTGEWGGPPWRRCDFDGGSLTGRADGVQAILTGVMLHTPASERERRDLLSELGTKYGAPAEYIQSTSGFVLARWQLPGGTEVTYRELGPHGANVAWELTR